MNVAIRFIKIQKINVSEQRFQDIDAEGNLHIAKCYEFWVLISNDALFLNAGLLQDFSEILRLQRRVIPRWNGNFV